MPMGELRNNRSLRKAAGREQKGYDEECPLCSFSLCLVRSPTTDRYEKELPEDKR
jgi:hypothetical protein